MIWTFILRFQKVSAPPFVPCDSIDEGGYFQNNAGLSRSHKLTLTIMMEPSQMFLMSFVLGDCYLALVYLFRLCPSTVPFISSGWLMCASPHVAVLIVFSSLWLVKEAYIWSKISSHSACLSPQVAHHVGRPLHVTAAARTTRVTVKARAAPPAMIFPPPALRASQRLAPPRELSSVVQSVVSHTHTPRSRP